MFYKLFFEIELYKKENTTEQAKSARWVVALKKYIILYSLILFVVVKHKFMLIILQLESNGFFLRIWIFWNQIM